MRALLLLTLFLLTAAGCGKKGALISPDAMVPATVQNMQVQQQGADFRISWQAPGREQGGRPLRDLAGFRLLRRDIAGDGSDCSSCPASWQLLTYVDLDLSETIVKSGATYFYFDRERPVGQQCQYRLVALSKSGGSSLPANSTVRKMLPAMAAPTLQASVQPGSVALAFSLPGKTEGKLLGFNIYRRQDSSERALLPLNSVPVAQNSWEDTQVAFGSSYRYSVTAVTEIGGESVESLPSAEAEVLFTLQELR